jgi:hypothetical protein
MAQTRKRRQTKHRGNAAGVVESRGRTGRKPTAQERAGKSSSKTLSAQQRREERLNRPPTWKAAAQRAFFAAIFFIGVVALFLKRPIGIAVAWGAFVLLFYIPMGYYLDLALYRRRQAKKAAKGD